VFEWQTLTTGMAWKLFKGACSSRNFRFLIHNASFDLQYLDHYYGFRPVNFVDTMALGVGVHEREELVGLERLARQYLNAPHYSEDIGPWYGKFKEFWNQGPESQRKLVEYNGRDCIYTARMFPILDKLCEREGTRDCAYDL